MGFFVGMGFPMGIGMKKHFHWNGNGNDIQGVGMLKKYSDVVLESGSVLESDSSTYFEDSDSDPLDSD